MIKKEYRIISIKYKKKRNYAITTTTTTTTTSTKIYENKKHRAGGCDEMDTRIP